MGEDEILQENGWLKEREMWRIEKEHEIRARRTY